MRGIRAADGKHPGTKHGMYRTPEYKIWKGMIDRCYNPNCRNYANYGGRGIAMCDRWRKSFKAFIEDMGRRPSSLHSLDRKDNSGNYGPENCRWATRSEQQRNTRQNVLLTKDGVTLTMIEWAERLGLKYETIRFRRYRG